MRILVVHEFCAREVPFASNCAILPMVVRNVKLSNYVLLIRFLVEEARSETSHIYSLSFRGNREKL